MRRFWCQHTARLCCKRELKKCCKCKPLRHVQNHRRRHKYCHQQQQPRQHHQSHYKRVSRSMVRQRVTDGHNSVPKCKQLLLAAAAAAAAASREHATCPPLEWLDGELRSAKRAGQQCDARTPAQTSTQQHHTTAFIFNSQRVSPPRIQTVSP